jgi:hypothetical protein
VILYCQVNYFYLRILMAIHSRSMLPLETIRASDDPLTRLNLLEQVQGSRDWLATVVAESPAERETLLAVKAELDKKSYASYFDKGLHGQEVLRVHHLGRNSDIATGFENLGMVRGIRHAVENIAAPVGDAASAVGAATKYTMEDPARLMAGIYMLGDLSYIGAGKNFSEPKEALKSMSGIMATIQSLIFLAYAKDSSEYHLKDVGKALDKVAEHGLDALDASIWSAERKENHSMIGKLEQLLKRHPIEIGAATQILGQIGLLVSGGLNIKETGKGLGDMGRSMASITGWAMLMAHETPCENKTPWNANPFARVSQEFGENPSRFASTITTMASVIGLAASHENHSIQQALAEASYLMGDATMFFIDRGDDKANAASKAAAEFVYTSPILFSPTTQTAFVRQLSHYLAERMVAERLERTKPADHPDTEMMVKEETSAIAQDLAKNIFKELAGKDQRMDKVANTVARLSELFPANQRDAVELAVVETIMQLSGVCVQADELHNAIKTQRERFVTQESPASAPSMGTVSSILAELTFQLPSVNAGYNASRLFDTVSNLTRTTPAEDKMFEYALMQQAARDVGISSQMVQMFVRGEGVLQQM